jgi:hypothetical protein
MFSLFAQLCFSGSPSIASKMVLMAQCRRSSSIAGAYSEVGGFFYQATNLNDVEEDCRVNWPRSRRDIVAQSEGLEDFGRELQPRTVEAGDVAPMPTDNC